MFEDQGSIEVVPIETIWELWIQDEHECEELMDTYCTFQEAQLAALIRENKGQHVILRETGTY